MSSDLQVSSEFKRQVSKAAGHHHRSAETVRASRRAQFLPDGIQVDAGVRCRLGCHTGYQVNVKG